MTWHWNWEPALLEISDLGNFADAATRMQRSLSCLIGAMESGEAIAWMAEEPMKYRIKYREGIWHCTEPSGEVTWHFRTLNQACDFVCESARSNR